MVAIDEVHCSQSMRTFREHYESLQGLKDSLPHIPVMLLTATARSTVRDSFIHAFCPPQFPTDRYVDTVDRPNVRISIQPLHLTLDGRPYSEAQWDEKVQFYPSSSPIRFTVKPPREIIKGCRVHWGRSWLRASKRFPVDQHSTEVFVKIARLIGTCSDAEAIRCAFRTLGGIEDPAELLQHDHFANIKGLQVTVNSNAGTET